MSPGRAEAHAEDARSALTRRLARSYLRPDIAPSHRACAVHSRESTSVPSRLSSAAPPLSAEPTGLNPPTPVSGEPQNQPSSFSKRLVVLARRSATTALNHHFMQDTTLEHAARHSGATHTGIEWHFHHFGPWSLAAHDRIEPALVRAGAVEKHFSSAYGNDHLRYLLDAQQADRFEEALTAELPHSVTRAITTAVHDHGSDTAGLLRHVYLTAPMLAARPGQVLDFTSAILPAEPSPSPEPQPRVRHTRAERRRRADILDAGRRKIRQLIAERRSSRVVPPGRPARYDSVFVTGVEALDRQAGDPPKATSGRLIFDDSVWSSSQRRDPEVP